MSAGMAAGSAHAQQVEAVRYDWSGFYIGAHLGGGLQLSDVADPFGPSLYGDTVRAPGPVAGGQAGYNWQLGRTLLGIEADVSWADFFGTNTCFAYSGFYVSANCVADADALGTLSGAPRLDLGCGRRDVALRQSRRCVDERRREIHDQRRSWHAHYVQRHFPLRLDAGCGC